ncbi:hypothetical protein DL98DRAFT_660239 [Cadophora sp. DSE1049]|nr:hypothetical protein DL98DRAFT_660239 [Cadophora sp. DSE1049]
MEKANLARVRDNQRRSRVRRREYLQELESRLRQCELQGIALSSEIQSAARRVAEENKKLLALLAQHGVRDKSIEAYLQTPSTADTLIGGQYGSHSKAVQVLEQLLSTRKGCCTDGTEPSGGGQSCDRESPGSVTTTQSTWDPSRNAKSRRRSGIQQAGRVASMQYITPTGSSTSSATLGHSTSHAMTQHQRLVPAQMGRDLSPGSKASNQNRQHHQMYDYCQQYSLSNQSYSSIQNNPPEHQYQNMQQSSSVYVSTTSNPNVSNSDYAGEMVTTMAGVCDSSTVRADAGCAPGMECEVDSHRVVDIMDRYSGIGL